jgi:Fe-S oxidoreductase
MKQVVVMVATVNVCRKHGAPILSRGGGTSLAGQCCNVAVVMDMSKYLNRVLSIDGERKIAACRAGGRTWLVNLFPDDPDAQRLSRQSFLLADFLKTQVPGYRPPRLAQRVMMHGHCHHRPIATTDAEATLLSAITDDVEMLDSGCCGMAGSFGFEANHYDVSMQVGDLVLVPAVRQASPDTLIVADGFSCREQIEQGTRRRAVHVAQAMVDQTLPLRYERSHRKRARVARMCFDIPTGDLL